MIQTTLCYLTDGKRVLMLYRNKKKNDLNEGKWVGVGGKFLPGETPDACVLREVKEETGLTLTSYRKLGVIHFHSDRWEAEEMHLYMADGFTGTEIPCNEGELKWIPREEVLSLPMWAGDRLFLEPMMAGETSIELTLRYEGNDLVEVIRHGNDL